MTPEKKSAGTAVFGVASALLWCLAAYLGWSPPQSDNGSVYAYAAAFAALVLTAHTVLFARYADRKWHEGNWFRAHGKPIEAQITRIKGSRRDWRVRAVPLGGGNAPETTFKSDRLRDDPNETYAVGDKVVVYLHPTDPRRYWMDLGLESRNL